LSLWTNLNVLPIVILTLLSCKHPSRAMKVGGIVATDSLVGETHVFRRLDRLSEGFFKFWMTYGPDQKYGGFHGVLDIDGQPILPDHKTVVQQSQHLWALAAWSYYRGSDSKVKKEADQVYRFLKDRLYDKSQGNFYFSVDRTGKRLINRKKQIYAQASAIYGLAQYYQAYKVEEAKVMAMSVFNSLEPFHDEIYGGYDQTNDPGWLMKGAAKGSKTHLHLMEAFTLLFEVTLDKKVLARLKELVNVVADKMRQTRNYGHVEFTHNWQPVGNPKVSYGDDFQTCWLIMTAARVVGRFDDRMLRSAALHIGRRAANEGFDLSHGGYFEQGTPDGKVTSPRKIWWVQMEAMAGLWWLYHISADETYMMKLEKTLTWVERRQRSRLGELYWEVDNTGDPVGEYKYLLGEQGKTAYHTLRAALIMNFWAKEKH